MADIAGFIDGLIEPFSPALVRKRMAERGALKVMRQYDAAAGGRRTAGWKRTASSADREVRQGLVKLRDGARELCRNNKYAASSKRQLLANLVGNGISARATHADDKIAAVAQAWWEDWAHGKVDGRRDFYGVQKLAVAAMIEGGEGLIVWSPLGKRPDARCRVLEGDYLDHLKNNFVLGDGRIVQGVEFDADGDRAGYWLHPSHPGDFGGYYGMSARYDAADVDHLFEELRAGQTRGVSWFAPVMMTLRDEGDYEEALLMKKKVEACLALILTPPENGASSPLAAQEATSADNPGRPAIETVRPAMIFRTKPGESATALEPSSGGDGIAFIHQQIAGVAANLAPYHLISGDVSKANYSSLRAANLGFGSTLDDWQQNEIIPFLCNPAFYRQMRVLALATGDKRYLEVRPAWAVPKRQAVDPIKDIGGEIMENRAGYKTMQQSLAERGQNWKTAYGEIAASNTLADTLGLVLDTDPRKVNATGAIQPPASFATPKADPSGADDTRLIDFMSRMMDARDSGDGATMARGFAEAADLLAEGGAMAQGVSRVLRLLFDDKSDN